MTEDFPEDAASHPTQEGGAALPPFYGSEGEVMLFCIIAPHGPMPYEGRYGFDRQGMEQWIRFTLSQKLEPQKLSFWSSPFSCIIQVVCTIEQWIEILGMLKDTARIFGRVEHIHILEHWTPGARLIV